MAKVSGRRSLVRHGGLTLPDVGLVATWVMIALDLFSSRGPHPHRRGGFVSDLRGAPGTVQFGDRRRTSARVHHAAGADPYRFGNSGDPFAPHPRSIPSRLILAINVVRGMPSWAAAPFGPPTVPPVCWMRERSASSTSWVRVISCRAVRAANHSAQSLSKESRSAQ